MMMTKENQNHGFDLVSVPIDRAKPLNPLPYDEVHPGRSEVGESPLPNDKHTCGLISGEAIRFIQKNKDHPFVLWCSFPGPHTPITPSAPWSKQYDPKKLTLPPNHLSEDLQMPGESGLLSKSGKYSNDFSHNQTLAYYYGLISQIDYNIGLMMAELDRLGLTENTIIVYTADHGEMMSEHKAWTKGMTGYDATIRVPLIIKYKDKFSGGRKIEDLTCSIDLLPTLLNLSGLDIPKNIEGKSLLKLTTDNSDWREYAFSELGSSTQNSVIAVRGKTEKYVLFRKSGKVEYEQLFDLKKDPWETTNLATNGKDAAVLAKMRSVLKKWEAETETTLPVKAVGKVSEE
jgi:arylsulfatase A-like enzyme